MLFAIASHSQTFHATEPNLSILQETLHSHPYIRSAIQTITLQLMINWQEDETKKVFLFNEQNIDSVVYRNWLISTTIEHWICTRKFLCLNLNHQSRCHEKIYSGFACSLLVLGGPVPSIK